MDARQRYSYPRHAGSVGAPPPELYGGAVALASLLALFPPEYVAWGTAEMRAEEWRAGHEEELRQWFQQWSPGRVDESEPELRMAA